MVQIVMIGLAGSIGAVVRYLLGRLVAQRLRSQIPFATLLINVSGSFLIGLLFVAALRHRISSTVQVTLATGFLGGYTTFSTMSWEGMQLIKRGNQRASFLYLGGTVALGLLAVAVGFAVGWVI
ncbi:MAG TPA: fluoride efflux transporter CrcB [Ktedonobacteraceae bacterium]|nr:fluoride efflux transporter CrcB [Ktedonobacteraceae bacterium]